MNCYSADAVSLMMAKAWLALILSSFVACWLGASLGRASYHFLFLFIRRTPRWRRFDRAMRKAFA